MLEIITQTILPDSSAANIFSFATFISGLALLVIVYTISSVRYHFRIAVTPFPIYGVTYILIAIIGIVTLMTDLYFSEGWDTPKFLSDPLLIQAILAAIFLLLVLVWMFFAFICPPAFNRFNYKKFTKILYAILAKGSDNELPVIADELGRSVESIIKSNNNIGPQFKFQATHKVTRFNYAHDLLMMIGHRKLCRYMIANAPGTAIELFKAMAYYEKYDIPIDQFSVNISIEALSNTDSPLYHEDDGYKSGLFGYVKPFSKAIYGNYILVEALASRGCSPLNLPYEFTSNWNSNQLKAYCRCVIITIESYLKNSTHVAPSSAIDHAIEIIANSCRDVCEINEAIKDYHNLNSYNKLHEVTTFVRNAIKAIDKSQPCQLRSYKSTNKFNGNIYDSLANLMFEVIFFVSHITTPADKCWSIQYASVWNLFFMPFNDSIALKVINHKLRRLLFNSIIDMNKYPNYKSARILGICLNVMGLTLKKEDFKKNYHSLHKIIIAWMIKRFRALAAEYPDIANTCLQGNVSYDKEKNQLIYSYVSGMKRESGKVSLQLS